jgi:hypothetical protein
VQEKFSEISEKIEKSDDTEKENPMVELDENGNQVEPVEPVIPAEPPIAEPVPEINRVDKFGPVWGDSTVSAAGHKVTVVIDNPLPDSDRITIETDEAKVAALITKAVAGMLLSSGNSQIKFFDGK